MTMIEKMNSQNKPRVMRSFRTCFGISLAFSFFALLFAACDAGLGESVDTLAPTVSISSPASSAVLGGAFTISGSCLDDKMVKYVSVSIVDTTTGKQVLSSNVPASGTTWSLKVNAPSNGVYPLKDGIYSANAVCYDMVGRQSGTASRVFEVDNTAPVFCVTKPNSVEIKDPAAYGRDVVVRGEIADDHPIRQMDIRVFEVKKDSEGGVLDINEITSTLKKTTFSGFETAGGTEVTIAKYFDDKDKPKAGSDDYPLYLNYNAMYGNLGAEPGDTVSLYVFPYLTDIAGNMSDKCYIQSPTKQLFSKACNVETTSDSLQTAQFKKILNGSYSLAEIDTGIAKEILAGTYDQKQISTDYSYFAHLGKDESLSKKSKTVPLAMSLNANNSPMYEFGGYSMDEKFSFAEVSSGGTMSIKVSAGLDGNEIEARTIRVYLWECEVREEDGKKKIVRKDPTKPSYSSDCEDTSKRIFVVDGDGKELCDDDYPTDTLVSNQTYKITLPGGMSAGARYELTAKGKDVANNPLSSGSSTYAFMVAMTGNAPKPVFADRFYVNALAFKKPAANDSNPVPAYTAKIKIEDKSGDDKAGTLQAGGDNGVTVTPVLYKGYAKTSDNLNSTNIVDTCKTLVYKGDADDSSTIPTGADGGIYKDSAGNYHIEVPLNIFDLSKIGNNGTVALTVTAVNTGSTTTDVKPFIIWADNAAPLVNVVAPEANANIFEYDDNISKDPDDASKIFYKLQGTWSDIDGSGTSEIWHSFAENPTAPSVAWTSATDWTVDADSSVWKKIDGASTSSMERNWNEKISAAETEGLKISFVAVDKAGNVSAIKSVGGITFDFNLPVIEDLKDKYEAYYKQGDDVEIAFTVTDTLRIAPAGVEVTAYKNGVKITSATAAANGYSCVVAQSKKDDGQGGLVDDPTSVTVTIKIAGAASKIDGEWNFEVSATDIEGHKNKDGKVPPVKDEFAFVVDTVKPVFVNDYTDPNNSSVKRAITIGTDGSTSSWHKSKNLTLSGKFKEETSGLDKVEYTVTQPDGTVKPKESASIGEKKGLVQYKISPAGFLEGTNYISIYGVDKAGNESLEAGPFTILVDATPPDVEVTHYIFTDVTATQFKAAGFVPPENPEKKDGTILISGEKNVIVYGTLTEATSGIDSLKLEAVKVDASTAAETRTKISEAWKQYAWTAPDGTTVADGFIALVDKTLMANLGDGDFDVNAVVTDKAGNKLDDIKFSVSNDADAPVINFESPKAGATINGSVDFSGSISDKSLKEVKAYWSLDSSKTIVDGRDYLIPGLSGSYSWSAPLGVTKYDDTDGKIIFADGSDFDKAAHSTIYLKVKAWDMAGNESVESQAYAVDPNSDRPTIVLSDIVTKNNVAPKKQLSDTDHYWYASKVIKGEIDDDDGVTGLDLYYNDNGEVKQAGGTYDAKDIFDPADSEGKQKVWRWLKVDNGSFTLENKAAPWEDGPRSIMFKVIDTKTTPNTPFVTKTSADEADFYLSPKIKLSDKEFESSDTNLYLTIDTVPPTISNRTYKTRDNGKSYPDDGEAMTGITYVGGVKRFMEITFDATDANGIKETSFTLNDKTTAGVFVEENTPGVYTYKISDIDVKNLPGDWIGELTVTAQNGEKTTVYPQINVDWTPPAVSVDYPASDATASAWEIVRGTVDKAEKMSYALTHGDVTKTPDAFKEILPTQSWSVRFDNDPNHDKKIEEYVIEWGVPAECATGTVTPTRETIDDFTFDAIVPIKIWVKAEDAVGNESITKHVFKFNPQAGRPTVDFGSPEKNGKRVGGNNIPFNGTADDDQSLKAVFLQIISKEHKTDIYSGSAYGSWKISPTPVDPDDPNKYNNEVTGITLEKDDLNYLKAAGYKIYKMRTYISEKKEWDGNGEPSEYGILANLKGGSWNLKINEKDEFSPIKGSSVTENRLIIKAISYDGEKLSVPKYRQVVVDNNKPTISNIFLRQYSGDEKVASKEYADGVYVKDGGWKLGFTLEDNESLAYYYMGSGSSADEAKDAATAKIDIDGAVKEYSVVKELSEDCGFVYVKFGDNRGNENDYAFEVNFDSSVPAVSNPVFADGDKKIYNDNGVYAISAKAEDAGGSGFDKFVVYYKRGDTVFDPMFPKGAKKQQDGKYKYDYAYSVASSSGAKYEDGLYWFKLALHATKGRPADNLSVLKLAAAEDVHVHKGRLVKIGGVVYTITDVGMDTDGKTIITLDGNVEADWKEAWVCYGIVIDNTTQENSVGDAKSPGPYGYKYPASISNTDGDGFVEGVQKSGADYYLSAELNSKNIPDGKINVYYVAYDKAGNFSTLGSVENAYVCNNSPRLAGVKVASDFNFDGNYDERDYATVEGGESRAYSGKTEWEKADASVTLGSKTAPWISAKGIVQVKPEVLGGNGTLTWTWTYPVSDVQTAGVGGTLSTDNPTENDEYAADRSRNVNKIMLPASVTSGAGKNKDLAHADSGVGEYNITISDDTDDDGVAQTASIKLYLKNDVNESNMPLGKTKRFFWKSLAKNSVYGSSAAKKLADLQGHIDLEKDGETADGASSNTTNTVPKVSGKIVLKGTAYDNAGIASLTVKVPGFTASGDLSLTATRTFGESGAWTGADQGDLAANGYHFVLEDRDENGNTITERFNNAGHFVPWTLVLDTEKYGGGTAPAATGVKFTLSVTDKNGNVFVEKAAGTDPDKIKVYASKKQLEAGKFYADKRVAEADNTTTSSYARADYTADEFKKLPESATATAVTEYELTRVRSDYTMDIVPYITRVTTKLTKVNQTNGIVDRSSLGAYPVYVYTNSTSSGKTITTSTAADDNETVQIYGFNLAGAKYGATDIGSGTKYKTAKAGSYGTGYVELDSDKISSGSFELTVGTVATINNTNNDDARGSYAKKPSAAGGEYDIYKNYYNRQPNNANNNNLTDNVSFDVWQLNNMAAAPMDETADDPQMRIRPSYDAHGNTVIGGGKIGFAFSNGSSAFTMPNKDYSWTYWAYDYDRVRYVGLNYDPQGYAWAAATGQDTHGSGGDPFFMETTRNRQYGGNGTGSGHSPADITDSSQWRLERICITDADHIMQDRIQSPVFANTTNGVYLAYYYIGETKGEIRFRLGNSASADYVEGKTDYQFDFFQNDGASNAQPYSVENVQLLAGGEGHADYKATPHLSLAAVDGIANIDYDCVVIVWYDGSKMIYGYAYSPSTRSAQGDKQASNWTFKTDIFPAGVGEYCKVAVDHDGHIHIAAYDSSNSDVWYAYLPSYNGTATTCKVDGYNSTGAYLTLDAALDASGNPAPQIGFYSTVGSRPKYARWNAANGNLADKLADGVDSNDSYTGNWEVVNIPTQSAVRTSDSTYGVKQNVNVGVWKNARGRIMNSPTGSSFCIGSGTGGDSGENVINRGDVYGNGTANAVLSYVYGSSTAAYIETAQRK